MRRRIAGVLGAAALAAAVFVPSAAQADSSWGNIAPTTGQVQSLSDSSWGN